MNEAEKLDTSLAYMALYCWYLHQYHDHTQNEKTYLDLIWPKLSLISPKLGKKLCHGWMDELTD